MHRIMPETGVAVNRQNADETSGRHRQHGVTEDGVMWMNLRHRRR